MFNARMRGSIDAALMFGLTLMLNFGLYFLSQRMSLSMGQAYYTLGAGETALEDQPPSSMAFGQNWQTLPPRIDFAAHHHPKEDAQALCYIVANYGCAAPGINFQCY